jgi:hypothetical protein
MVKLIPAPLLWWRDRQNGIQVFTFLLLFAYIAGTCHKMHTTAHSVKRFVHLEEMALVSTNHTHSAWKNVFYTKKGVITARLKRNYTYMVLPKRIVALVGVFHDSP